MKNIIQSIKCGDKRGSRALIESSLYHKAGMLVEERKKEFGCSLIKEDKDDTTIKSDLQNYEKEDFVSIAKAKLGWAIAEQLESILGEESLEDQNPNALERIVYFCDEKGEKDLADEIAAYLTDEMGMKLHRSQHIKHKGEDRSDHDWLEDYSQEDFVLVITAEYGTAVAEQAKAILDGEAMEDQNSNALRYIMKFARMKGEDTLADKIKEYLDEE